MDFIELVKQKRAENISVYSNTDRFKADYKAENSIKADYEGRQLLELLQNADDAKAQKVKIFKDSVNHSITISNTGEPFSVEGFGALMLSYNGTKSAGKKEFIGNKGLGFKSILNWATSVDVKSNGCHVHFSRKTAYDVAKRELANNWAHIQTLINSLGLVNKEIAPILSLPEIKECEMKPNGWDTEITIHYNPSSEIELDIDNQINLLNTKSLLFVSNIRHLEIEGSKSDRSYDSSFERKSQGGVDYYVFTIAETKQGKSKSHQYRLFKQEGVVDRDIQEKEQKDQLTEASMYYEVCIALDGEIGEKEYLYSYFRTNIMVGLPCIIHAAFRLDSSRNSLVSNSIINDFLIKKIVSQFETVIKFLCKTEQKSWRAFKLINFEEKPEQNQEYLVQLYDDLETLKYKSEIFPCVDGRYRELDESRYYDDAFSSFIEENYSEDFPDMLIPTKGICQEEIDSYVDDDSAECPLFYREDEIWEKLDELCKRDLSIQQRVDLLKALSSEKVIEHIPNGNDRRGQTHLLSILLDEHQNVIPPRQSIYTTPLKPLTTPSFANISFIGGEFYEALKVAFPFNPDEKDPELNTPIHARQICKRIKHYVKLKAHDVANLTPEIINVTNSRIDSLGATAEGKKCLIETVQVLFHNHEVLANSGEGSENKYDGLRLIAKSGDIVDAKTLYLSSTYKSGAITEAFYGDVISKKEYVADRSVYGIVPHVDDAPDAFEEFLVLCGVTRFVRYNRDYTLTKMNAVDVSYLQKYLAPNCEEFKKYDCKNYPINKVCKLTDTVKLDRLSITKTLILLAKEKTVYSGILGGSNLVYSGERLKGQYNVHSDISLIAYQVMNRFSSIVLQKDDSEINFLLNPNGGIEDDLLRANGVFADGYAVLSKLGVKENFQQASSAALYKVIRRVYENRQRYPKGRGIQKIYGDVYDVLKKKNDRDHGELMLACREGNNDVEFKKNSEIYYYDDATLPKTMLSRYPIFLFRQRAGIDQVVDYFGVKRLDVSSLIIDESSMDERKELSQEFNKHYYDRIPFIVMQRIRGLASEKSQREEAQRANILFHLVKSGTYSYSGDSTSLAPYEFLIKGRNAYIQVPDMPLKALIRDKKVLDAFSEILGIAFALESVDLKKIFRTILRDDLPTLRADAEEDLDEYERALELLNRSESSETAFWNVILKKKHMDSFGHYTGLPLETYIHEKLGYNLPDCYVDVDFELLDNEASFNLIKDIHDKLQLELKDFLPVKGLVAYHREKLKNAVRHYYKAFISQLWNNLRDKEEENQRQYCRKCYDYESCDRSIPMDGYEYVLDLDYAGLLKEYVAKNYDLNLDSGECPDYKGILYAGYTDGRDASLTLDDRSLLYFEGNEEKFSNPQIDDDGDEDGSSGVPDEDIPVGVVGVIKPIERKPRERASHTDENNPWNADEKTVGKKKKAGRKAQEITMQWLKNEFGEASFRLRSSESDDPSKNDAAHYDILYCETPDKKDAEWRYLEVKNASSKMFVMSEAEVEFACKPENRKKYDLALVDGKKVQIVKSFFANYESSETFIEAFKPHIHRDFLVSFKFENSDEVESVKQRTP